MSGFGNLDSSSSGGGGIAFGYHPRRWTSSSSGSSSGSSSSKDNGNAGYLFSVASNNVQGHRSGHDSSNIRKSIDFLTRIASSFSPEDEEDNEYNEEDAAHRKNTSIIALQEVQQCRDKIKYGGTRCKYCAANACEYDHAEIVHRILCSRNYQGSYHCKMKNTVGLYFDADVFDLVDGTFRFVDLDNGKGSILAVLQYKDETNSGYRSSSDGNSYSSSNTWSSKQVMPLSSSLIGRERRILVVSLHLSVPINQNGDPDTIRGVNQVRQLFTKISSVWRANHGPLPTLLLGDFNSLPYDSDNPKIAKADVYRCITDPESELNVFFNEMVAKWHKTEVNEEYRREEGEGEGEGRVAGACDNVEEELSGGGEGVGWRSTYVEVNGEEPTYTSTKRGPPGSDCSKDFIHCIDYIFYRSTPSMKLRPTRVLSVEPMDRDSLPYPATPSDHLPIAAFFSLDKD